MKKAVAEGREDTLVVYHGSKNGLEGPIRMVAGRNRRTCDFGQGFYMGDEPTQPRTLICDGERPNCAISRKAFSRISIVSEKRFSSRECELFRAKSERQRRRAVATANEICVSMRREGVGFLDLVKRRMERMQSSVPSRSPRQAPASRPVVTAPVAEAATVRLGALSRMKKGAGR